MDEDRGRGLEWLVEAILAELAAIREGVERTNEQLEETNRLLGDIYATQVS